MTRASSKREQTKGLIGRRPHPVRDQEALEVLGGRAAGIRDALADDLAEGRLWRAMSLSELLPGLDSIWEPPLMNLLSVRSWNALRRNGFGTWVSLARVSPDRLMMQENFGNKSLHEVLAESLRYWARLHLEGAIPAEDETSESTESSGEETDAARVAEHVDVVCAWALETHGARGLVESVEAARTPDQPVPETVRLALDELAAIEVSPGIRERFSLKAAFEALEEADPIQFEVFKVRHLDPRLAGPDGAKRPTLDQIGKKVGITRERVRQLEKSVRKRVAAEMKNADSPIRIAAERVRLRFGSLARADELPAVGEALDPNGDAFSGAPHRLALLLELAGDYRLTDRWVITPDIEARTQRVLQSITKEGPVSLEKVCGELRSLGVREALQVAWLEDQAGFRVIGDMCVRWGRSMGDKAVAVLGVAGEPLELEDLFERIGEDKNFRGFKSQVQGDKRVRRRGVKRYGLEEWGGEEYTTIVDEMTQELERHGGSMDLEVLAATLSRNFGVSKASVHMYAGGPQFEVNDSGAIQRRSGALPIPPSRPLELTRCCYRLEDGWALRRTVDHDVLRGSGAGLPLAFAKEMGLRPTDSRQFPSPFGEIWCSWPSHVAQIGSMRAAAKELGAVEGDHLFVVCLAGEELDIRHVTAKACNAAKGWNRLALECGRNGGSAAMSEVATALAVGSDEANVDIAIRLRLRERGEKDLADLVPRSEAAGGDVLDALASLGD